MHITPHLSLVASGRLGFMLTDPLDCNVYLLECGDGLALIDAGAGLHLDAMLDVIRGDGFDPAHIRHIFLTHGHADHAGGCAELHQRYGAAVWASGEVADFVRRADETAISLDAARAAGIYPRDFAFRACPVAHIAEDGVPIQIGRYSILPIATPGHAAGHMAYLMTMNEDSGNGYLFVGDLLMCGGRVLMQYTYDCSPILLGRSIERLAGMQFDALLPGHLHFCLNDGKQHVETALSYLRRLLIPPSV
jgi:glyoxylase-like metal-dependent hydrolase (beta-lactamase superfamily II)